MRFHSAGRNLRWGADDECIVRLISTSKKCGGYADERCACMCLCVNVRETQEADGEGEHICD